MNYMMSILIEMEIWKLIKDNWKTFILPPFIFFTVIIGIYIIYSLGDDKREMKKRAKLIAKNNKKGNKYENCISKAITSGLKEKVHRQVIVPSSQPCGTSESDIVFVNSKGLFCIECKYHDGSMKYRGNLTDNTLHIDGREEINPIVQNRGHLICLHNALARHGIKVPMFNVVTSTAEFDLFTLGRTKTVTWGHMDKVDNGSFPEPTYILCSSKGSTFCKLKKEIKSMPDVLSKEEVRTIDELLKSWEATEDEHKQHVARVQEMMEMINSR